MVPDSPLPAAGRRFTITGHVQGVGFRPWVWRLARDAGVTGEVSNGPRGVVVEAFGSPSALEALEAALGRDRPAAARVTGFLAEAIPPRWSQAFVIAPSDRDGPKVASIPPDLATCERCLAEVLDPNDRRHGYAFTNCTQCGPRFTIAWDVPYDRQATTMAGFRMCPDCRREYDDPADRRFHAQPNACPACGPRLDLRDGDGALLPAEDPLLSAAAALRAGRIVALKGLGGFHLACDATDEAAVGRLRERKRREEKPFAVMVADLEQAGRLVRLDALGASLLAGADRPIVLLPRRDGGDLAAAVAPDAPNIGLMLPYTPLHHLLLRAVGRPLVMTSGNASGEPLARDNDEALRDLAGVADLFLLHDRGITTRTDDSVVAVVAGRPAVWRRSRGHVPRPVRVRRPFRRPVLAVGAHLKNTFCVGVGENAWLGPHVGDLDTLAAADAMAESIERFLRFLEVRPEVVACDLHPEYLSSRYARALQGVALVEVQHHHAHAVAAMAEHGLDGPALAVTYDGVGLGDDGLPWGAELLRVTPASYERLATWRPIPLPGGDLAVRETWRLALALLDDAWGGEAPLDGLPLFLQVDARALRVARQQVARGLNAPRAHSMGRLFEGISALALARPRATYEGQLAMAWERTAAPEALPPYPTDIDTGCRPWQVDHRPLVRAAVADLRAGAPPAVVSARFHAAVAHATTSLVRAVDAERLPVVLAGGCFQNTRLAADLLQSLERRGTVCLPEHLPVGDGGLALGQAVVAGALTY